MGGELAVGQPARDQGQDLALAARDAVERAAHRRCDVAAAAIALFSQIGLETVPVAAGRVREPGRNVPRATVHGTLARAAVYLLGTLAVFGAVPHAELVSSTAPFTDVADHMAGASWAGDAVAVAAIVSGIGALGGWTMVCAEMPYAAAREGLFPKAFARKRGDTPVFGILAATVLASLITVAAYTSFDNVFTGIVLLSVLTAAIPYLFPAAAQLYRLLTHARQASRGRFARDVLVAGTALAFSYWSIQAARVRRTGSSNNRLHVSVGFRLSKLRFASGGQSSAHIKRSGSRRRSASSVAVSVAVTVARPV
ncbi:amino acid permease [Embleya sp. NPDC005971]|uniref:amino acid permease n=1 Tax=Embleya sp. NPDC005971 TaxID=3156724 RepID=UPI0033EF2360